MSCSELGPRKVELMCTDSKIDDFQEYFTHNNKAYNCSYESQSYGSDIY